MTQTPRATTITNVGFCKDCDAVVEGGGRELKCNICNKTVVVEGWFETVTKKEEDPKTTPKT